MSIEPSAPFTNSATLRWRKVEVILLSLAGDFRLGSKRKPGISIGEPEIDCSQQNADSWGEQEPSDITCSGGR
jgi:hypothetical protein